MRAALVERATAAATSIASGLGLPVDDAVVLHSSNKVAVHLVPCDAFARVAPVGIGLAQFEIALAQRLADAGGPVAALDPRVEPKPYELDGFEVSLWTYYAPASPPDLAPADFADALQRLHAGMRAIDMPTPHFTERVADPGGNIDTTPVLDDADRRLLRGVLRDLGRAVAGRRAPEQLLHGEPHPGNVLNTAQGARFIDLETCCRGPVEFDLAHVPEAVSERYHDLDDDLLRDCRGLVLAIVAKHRCAPGDELPNGLRALRELLGALRAGPPWPALDVVMRRAGVP